ncbi:LPS export ABC transporter periplasmic protein LptC [candidate division KSB1 bacterium]|nr:LPS export ABC transporter periplasmic protein LptC [candidate division KSB1 bacterium]
MVNMKKLSLVLFVAILSIFLILSNCRKKHESASANSEDLEFPDQEGWNSVVTTTKNGLVSAIIHYGRMQQFKKKKVVELFEGIKVDFFDEKGKPTSNLISETGKINEVTNDIEASGNVVVVSDTGITLRTKYLKWDNNIEKIISNEFVTIITADQDTFFGKGFESDQNLNNWRILDFSGKASRGFDLNFQLKKKSSAGDSVTGKITNETPDSLLNKN